MVRGLVPAMPAEKYIHQQIEKRIIRPRTESDFKTTNIVRNHAWKISQCYVVETIKTPDYKNSFFPRTIINWNNLEEDVITSDTVAAFRSKLVADCAAENIF